MAAPVSETQFVLNSLSFLMHGFLVMWMAAGFAMLEAGPVGTKNTASIWLKNVALYSIAGVTFYLIGDNLMYDGVDGGFIGSFTPWAGDNSAALGGTFDANYAAESDWFFQMVFVATAASIVSEPLVRTRLDFQPLLEEPVCLVGPRAPVAGSGRTVPPGRLADHPLILPSSDFGLRGWIDQVIHDAGIELDVVAEANR